MNLRTMRSVARSGDKLTVRSTGIVGVIIRAVMGDSESHVAILKFADGVWMVDEMREFEGYRTTPLLQWCEDEWLAGKVVQYVAAPDVCCADQDKALDWLQDVAHKKARYGYLTLPIIWLIRADRSNKLFPFIFSVFKIDPNRLSAVCSIFAQRFDEHMGFSEHEAMFVAPGAFGRYPDGKGSFVLES